MKRLLFIISFLSAVLAWGTSGNPMTITEIYYNPNTQKVIYLFDTGHFQEIYERGLNDKKPTLVETSDNEAGELTKWESTKKGCVPLQRVDFSKANFWMATQFSKKQTSKAFQWKNLSEEDRDFIVNYDLSAGHINTDYNVAISDDKGIINRFQIKPCVFKNQVVVEAYSLPNLNFIIWINRAVEQCFEYQYIKESLSISPYEKNINSVLGDTCSVVPVAENMEFGYLRQDAFLKSKYRLIKSLPRKPLAEKLNELGIICTQEKKYEAAIEYFNAANHLVTEHKLNYYEPLYNIACAQMNLEAQNQAIKSLQTLLKEKPSYLSKIKNNPIFDKLKSNEKFKKLEKEI